MSCKKPILMAIDGVSRELIEVAQCGLYAEPEDAKTFASKVLFYFHNKEKAIEAGMKGYEYAKNNFDRKQLAKDYLKALLSINKHV